MFSLMMLGESAFNLICFMAASRGILFFYLAKGVKVNILNSRLGPGFQKMLLGGSIISFVWLSIFILRLDNNMLWYVMTWMDEFMLRCNR